eukprot:TRINITY_DN5790_c0_g2_i1.p2 TRINITY_DN5790_c0_g2~~TRINITY_DN5790_c0_g2_i1.p2  ORF type:complete len:64 (+),score=7.16 TRINITY_DN5790_c0_g2_i1:222-413(+)
MNGLQKFRITLATQGDGNDNPNWLPTAHTCFNQLDLPAYASKDMLRTQLIKAIKECSHGFAFH